MKKVLFLTFMFFSINLFALKVTKVDTLHFGSINVGKTIKKRISASEGARIFVRGIPGETVEAKIDDNIILNSNGVKFKVENINFERSKIVLDKVGKGMFRVGGVISIIEKKSSGDISGKIWIKLKYDD